MRKTLKLFIVFFGVSLFAVEAQAQNEPEDLMDSLAYQKASMIRQQLVAGADFAAMAKRFSADPGSRERGGEIGYMAPGSLVEPYWNAAYDLEVGEMSEPIKSEYGYHIIEVLGKKGGFINTRHILISIQE